MKKNFMSLAMIAIFSASVSLYGQFRTETISSPAAQYIAGEVEKQSKQVAVYKDFGDGMNRYTQRAALNPDAKNEPVLDETAPSPFGTSCIKVTYPLVTNDWNGFIFITGKLPGGSIVPELDFGATNTGQDLRGAKRLKFKARGEKGGESRAKRFADRGAAGYLSRKRRGYRRGFDDRDGLRDVDFREGKGVRGAKRRNCYRR